MTLYACQPVGVPLVIHMKSEELVYCLMSFLKQVLEKLICNTLRAWNFVVWELVYFLLDQAWVPHMVQQDLFRLANFSLQGAGVKVFVGALFPVVTSAYFSRQVLLHLRSSTCRSFLLLEEVMYMICHFCCIFQHFACALVKQCA